MAKKKTTVVNSGSVDRAIDTDLADKIAAANKELDGIEFLPEQAGAQDFTVKLFPSGILTLDKALNGGLGVGRITELYGEELSGKSLIALTAAGAAQRQGKRVLLFDVEGGLNSEWATKLGVDVPKLVISDNNVIEDIMTIIDKYATKQVVDMVIIDSLAMCTTKDVESSALGAPKYASIAKVLTPMLPHMLKVLKRNNVSLIMINQVRDSMDAYLKMLQTPGGRAIKHAYQTRIQVFKATGSKMIKTNDDITGVEIECQVKKHRGGANFTRATFRIDYKDGLDKVYDLVRFLLDTGHIVQNGAFYTYGDQKYHGERALMDAFRGDPAAFDAAFQFARNLLLGEVKDNLDTSLPNAGTTEPEPEKE